MAWVLDFKNLFFDIFELSSCLTLPMSTSAFGDVAEWSKNAPAKGVYENRLEGSNPSSPPPHPP